MKFDLIGKSVKDLRLSTVDYNNSSVKIIPAQENDVNSRFFSISLFDDRGIIELSAYTKVLLNASLPDGTSQFSEGCINESDNTAICKLAGSMLSQVGKVSCDILLSGEDSEGNAISLTSQTFYVLVSKSQHGSEALEGNDDVSLLVKLINDVTKLEENYFKRGKITSTNEFNESKLPSKIYYKVIEPEWVNNTVLVDESTPYEVSSIEYAEEEITFTGMNDLTLTADAGDYYIQDSQWMSFPTGELEPPFPELPPLQRYTQDNEKLMVDSEGKFIRINTEVSNVTGSGSASSTYLERMYITTFRYEDGSPVTAPLTLYPAEIIECYDFENLQFTTEVDGNTLLGDVYSYLDEWDNRCYTIYPDYTPNIKEGTSAISLAVSDPEDMLYSIKLEALFNGDYKYSLGNKDFSFMGGTDVVANGNGAFSSGKETFVTGSGAHGLGTKNFIRAQSGTGIGYNHIVTGRHAIALNEGNKVLGYAALGLGDHNTIIGSYGLAGGHGVRVFADTSIGYGSSIDVHSRGSLVGGSEHSIGDGFGNIVWGKRLTSGGYENAIFGSENTSTGMANIIGGKANNIGSSSFNIVGGGSNTIISDNCYYNILGGSDNTLSNSSSRNIVGGYRNKLDNSSMNIVGGREHEINAQSCIILGMGNYIKGSHGGAIGQGLNIRCVNGVPNFGIGRYNLVDWKENLLTVGNGTSDTDRSNAFVVKNDGRAVLGADPEEKMDAVTKQYFDSAIGDIESALDTIIQIQNTIIGGEAV